MLKQPAIVVVIQLLRKPSARNMSCFDLIDKTYKELEDTALLGRRARFAKLPVALQVGISVMYPLGVLMTRHVDRHNTPVIVMKDKWRLVRDTTKAPKRRTRTRKVSNKGLPFFWKYPCVKNALGCNCSGHALELLMQQQLKHMIALQNQLIAVKSEVKDEQ